MNSTLRLSSLAAFALVGGCKPAIDDLVARVHGDAVVISGKAKRAPAGADLVARGWSADGQVKLDSLAADGAFEVEVPLYKLTPGTLELTVELKNFPETVASSTVRIEVPPHTLMKVVACGGPAASGSAPSGRPAPPASPPGDGVSTASASIDIEGDDVIGPLRCGVDGAGDVVLKAEGPRGLEMAIGGAIARIGDDGVGDLSVPVVTWLAGLPLAGFGVGVEAETGATVWPSASAARVGPLQVKLELSLAGQKGAASLTLGKSFSAPVNDDDKAAKRRRIEALLALANAYMAVARASKRGGVGKSDKLAAMLYRVDGSPSLDSALIATNLYYFGEVATLGDVSRFGTAKVAGDAVDMEPCGPYREMGADDTGTTTTIPHQRVDLKVVAWSSAGASLGEALIEGGGVGCPSHANIDPLDTKPWRDEPSIKTLGAWLLGRTLE